MTLYRYVPSNGALLDGVVVRVLAGRRRPCLTVLMSYAWTMLTARSWRSALEATLPIRYSGSDSA
jgi:hypothetical protein